MISQGVIAESIISFKVTWTNPGNGAQPKWDQEKQDITIHETDVYPDLKYVSAYAAPMYVKYRSGSNLNELIMEINSMIDSKMKPANERALLPGPSKDPAKLPGGDVASQLLLAPIREPEALPRGPEPPKAIGPGKQPHLLPSPKDPMNKLIGPNSGEPGVTPEGDASSSKGPAYTVTVYGERLRLIEVQEERGAYAAGIRFLYRISNNLNKKVGEETVDNQTKIWAEVKYTGGVAKYKFEDFNEKEFKFGGNLLAQVLPSVELVFVPDPNSVYAREQIVADIADIVKAANLTLTGKSDDQLKSDIKVLQDEVERRTSKKDSTESSTNKGGQE